MSKAVWSFLYSNKKILGTLGVLCVGLLVLTQTQSLDLLSVWHTLIHVGPVYFLCAFGLSLIQLSLQASRLWALVPAPLHIPWSKVAKTFVDGQFVNTFTPARAGDGAKIFWLQKDEPLTVAHATGVILADKVVDITALLILVAGFGLPLTSLQTYLPHLGNHPWFTALLTVLGLVIVSSALIWIRPLRRWIQHFWVGMSTLIQPKPMSLSLCFATGVWIAEALVIGLLVYSQGTQLSTAEVLWILLVLNLGIAVPVAFANLGVFEAAMVLGLTQVGIPLNQALVVAILHHGAQLSSILLGLLGVRCFHRTSSTPQAPRSFHVRAQDKNHSIQHYQTVSQHYEAHVHRGPLKYLRERERRAILELAHIQTHTPKRMIDVGCGSGFYAQEAKKAGWWVCVTDVVPEFVKQLTHISDEQWVSDIEHLACTRTYDLVLCIGVLDFVADPDRALANLCALVAPHGRLIIHVPRLGLGGWYYRLEKKIERNLRVNLFSETWCKATAQKHGLRWIESRYPLPINMTLAFERS